MDDSHFMRTQNIGSTNDSNSNLQNCRITKANTDTPGIGAVKPYQINMNIKTIQHSHTSKEQTYHLSLGNAMLELGRHDQAINFFNKALQENPNIADAYNGIGIALSALSMNLEALNYFAIALDFEENPFAYVSKAKALKSLNCLSEAMLHIFKAEQIIINPKFSPRRFCLSASKMKIINESISQLRDYEKLNMTNTITTKHGITKDYETMLAIKHYHSDKIKIENSKPDSISWTLFQDDYTITKDEPSSVIDQVKANIIFLVGNRL